MSFTSLNLHQNITKAITACGYTKPTPIQSQTIPLTLARKDLIACAETGSGKTAAFVLPALHFLSTQIASKKTRVLILTPTRELAAQITKAAAMYGKFLQYNIVSLVGGMPYHHQIKDLQRGADIIVATPGRLLDHIQSSRVDLSHVEMLVLDEADRMLDMGFIDDVEYIAKLTPTARQTLLFSATIDKKLAKVVKNIMKDPVRIDLSHQSIAAPQIKQELYKVKNVQHKWRLLNHFLNDSNMYKAIIFSATKINADKLANQLRDNGHEAAALHGDLRQNVRNRTIEQLRRGKIQFLVATDVAARGIDIADLTHVINYDLPRFCEDYVHRIGRTGRAGKTGTAISFVLPTDARHLQNIERYLGQRIKLLHADGEELNEVVRDEQPARKEMKRESEFRSERRSFGKQNREFHGTSSRFERSDRKEVREEGEFRKKKKFFGKRKTEFNDTPRAEQSARTETRADGEFRKKKKFFGKRNAEFNGTPRAEQFARKETREEGEFRKKKKFFGKRNTEFNEAPRAEQPARTEMKKTGEFRKDKKHFGKRNDDGKRWFENNDKSFRSFKKKFKKRSVKAA